MKNEIKPEELKNTDNMTAEKIERNFEPDWEMDELFEKSYGKYSEMKNGSSVSETESNEKSVEIIRADTVPSGKSWRNTAIRITAAAAAAALVFTGIRYLPETGKSAGSDEAGVSDLTETPEISEPSDIEDELIEQDNISEITDSQTMNEYEMISLDNGIYSYITNAAMKDGKFFITGRKRNESAGVKRYSNYRAGNFAVPQMNFERILNACYDDNTVYALCECSADDGGICLVAADAESGYVLYRNYEISGYDYSMMAAGEYIVLTSSFDGTVTWYDRQLSPVKIFTDCYKLTGIRKNNSADVYGDRIYSVTVNEDGEKVYMLDGEIVDSPYADTDKDSEIRCILPTENNIYIAVENNDVTELHAFDTDGNSLWKKEYPEFPGIGYELYEDGDRLIFVTLDYEDGNADSDSYVHYIDRNNGDETSSFMMEHTQFVYFDYENRKFIGEYLSDTYYYDPETGEKSEVTDYRGYGYEDMIQSGRDIVIVPSEYAEVLNYCSNRNSADAEDENIQYIGNDLVHYKLTADGELYSYGVRADENLDIIFYNPENDEKTELHFTEPDRIVFSCYCTDDRVYLLTTDINGSNGRIAVYDRNGEKKGEYRFEHIMKTAGFASGPSGDYISVADGDTHFYSLSDDNAQEIYINVFGNDIYNGDSVYDFYFRDSVAGEVYGYKLSEGTSELVLKYSDYGINMITDFSICHETGEILCRGVMEGQYYSYWLFRKNS